MRHQAFRAHRLPLFALSVLASLAGLTPPAAPGQKVETVDGVRVVHNEKGGLWGKTPKVALELVRKIGDVDTEDENVAFNYPSDVAVDAQGNIHVLDSANSRIQKFGPDGAYLATIGRKGQGPGEFIMPGSIDIDKEGNIVVSDTAQSRIHVIIGGGRDVRSLVMKDERIYGLRCLVTGGYVGRASTYSLPTRDRPAKKPAEMRLLRTLDAEGLVTAAFGRLQDFGEAMTNAMGNACEFDVDGRGSAYVSFTAQNRIEKYGPDGNLVWRADRPLNYGTEVRKKGRIETSGGNYSQSAPEMNACSAGIAVDAKGRSWVVAYDRQLKKEEQVRTTMTTFGGPGGARSVSVKTEGNTDLRTTDALKLEIFDGEGVLLGELPLTHFADIIRIAGDSLFLIDRDRGVTVYQYRIVDQ